MYSIKGALQRHTTENCGKIPRKGIAPPFMFLKAIYIFPGSVDIFSCSQIGRPIVGIYKSLTDHECGNWDWGRAIPFLGIFVLNFRYCVSQVQIFSPLLFLLSEEQVLSLLLSASREGWVGGGGEPFPMTEKLGLFIRCVFGPPHSKELKGNMRRTVSFIQRRWSHKYTWETMWDISVGQELRRSSLLLPLYLYLFWSPIDTQAVEKEQTSPAPWLQVSWRRHQQKLPLGIWTR